MYINYFQNSYSELNNEEAQRALTKWGFNLIPEVPPRSRWKIFISKWTDFLIFLLLGAAIISVFLGEYQDAIAILAIVFFNWNYPNLKNRKALRCHRFLFKISSQ